MRLIAMPGNEDLAARLAAAVGARQCPLELRHFPDGESYVRLMEPVSGEQVCVVCTLDRPDQHFMGLAFVAAAAREAGATGVDLVAPYLAYMRQDRRFSEGEATSARAFAVLISTVFDSLLTIDPHLHRIRDLSEIFSIPARALHAAPLLADWISRNAPDAVVIGPDSESRQWVEAIARAAGVPFAVLSKTRHGDHEVSIVLPDLTLASGRRLILVDDIVSTGHTLLEAAGQLARAGFQTQACLAVHGLFAEGSYARLKSAFQAVVTTDSIVHASNGMSVVPLLAQVLAERP